MISGCASRQQRASESGSVTSPVQRRTAVPTSRNRPAAALPRTRRCTAAPSATRRLTRCEPRKPVPPVTRTVAWSVTLASADDARLGNRQDELAALLPERLLLLHDL